MTPEKTQITNQHQSTSSVSSNYTESTSITIIPPLKFIQGYVLVILKSTKFLFTKLTKVLISPSLSLLFSL